MATDALLDYSLIAECFEGRSLTPAQATNEAGAVARGGLGAVTARARLLGYYSPGSDERARHVEALVAERPDVWLPSFSTVARTNLEGARRIRAAWGVACTADRRAYRVVRNAMLFEQSVGEPTEAPLSALSEVCRSMVKAELLELAAEAEAAARGTSVAAASALASYATVLLEQGPPVEVPLATLRASFRRCALLAPRRARELTQGALRHWDEAEPAVLRGFLGLLRGDPSDARKLVAGGHPAIATDPVLHFWANAKVTDED